MSKENTESLVERLNKMNSIESDSGQKQKSDDTDEENLGQRSNVMRSIESDNNQNRKSDNADKKMKAKSKLTSVSLLDVCSDGHEERSDNTVLRFMILHIRKAQLKFVRTFSSRQSKWNLTPNLSYDRIVTCADLSSDKGSCFCFIYFTQRESDFKLQRFKLNNCGVGEIGEVREPLFTRRTLGSSDVPILEHKRPLEYIEGGQAKMKKLQIVPYLEDSLPNFGTRFFYLKNLQLHVQNLTMEDPICTGYMCDRQEIKTVEGSSCGCLIQSDNCNVVMSCNLFFRSKEGKLLFTVRNFRSWVFTKLLCGSSISYITSKADYGDEEVLDNVREHMSIITDYVNCAEGWSVMGWYRVGMLQDAADAAQDAMKIQAEMIAAETVIPHVSRLWPTDVDIRELNKFQVQSKVTVVDNVTVPQGRI